MAAAELTALPTERRGGPGFCYLPSPVLDLSCIHERHTQRYCSTSGRTEGQVLRGQGEVHMHTPTQARMDTLTPRNLDPVLEFAFSLVKEFKNELNRSPRQFY